MIIEEEIIETLTKKLEEQTFFLKVVVDSLNEINNSFISLIQTLDKHLENRD